MFINILREYHQRCSTLSIIPTKWSIIISTKKQSLFLAKDNILEKSYSVSTSTNPPSCIENSYGTPNGLHFACELIGENAEEGMVFKGRVPTGQKYWECSSEDQVKSLITTRIIRLKGLERDLNLGENHDTFDRYVYIHGTNHENKIGKPASIGCIHLNNKEMLEIFEKTPINSHVYISLN